MTERRTESMQTADSTGEETTNGGVEIFDTNSANIRPNPVATDTKRNTVHDARPSTDRSNATTAKPVAQGRNWRNILTAVALIIVIILLVSWIF